MPFLCRTRLVLSLNLCLIVVCFASPPSVRSLRLLDNHAVSTREIVGWLSTKPGLPLSETVLLADLRSIAENYRARGYLGARADIAGRDVSADSATVELTIRVTEGKQTLVGSIGLVGEHLFTADEILGAFDVHPGSPLDQSLLEKDISDLLIRYEKLGYPFAQCRVDGMTLREGSETDSLDIALLFREGDRVTIDEIRVQGNKETDPWVVIRETRLTPGELYNPAKVSAIRQRLSRLNIFASVSEPELYLKKEKGGLLIRVQEGTTNTFDGVVGYMPGIAPGESGYLTGLASVAFRNLFGTARKLSFRWQKEDRYSQELGVQYVEPWLLGAPINLGGGFFQRQQDSSYVRRALDLKGELMLSEDLSVGLLMGSESVIPSADSTVQRAFRSSTLTIGGEVQYDTRDDIYSPSHGAHYYTDYQYGRKHLSDSGTSVTVQRVTVDCDFFLPTFSRQVVAIGLHGRQVQGGKIEESQMYRFGGTNSLRGYRENQFLGSRIAWTNTEYRFLLARRSYVFGFMDTGYYSRPSDDLRGIAASEAFKYGYGFGIRLDTALGNIGVSFALGQGDSFGTGKIHVGLINEF